MRRFSNYTLSMSVPNTFVVTVCGHLQDEEGFEAIEVEMKAYKSVYRDRFAELHAVRSELEYAQHLVDCCKAEVVADFEVWCHRHVAVPLSRECPENENTCPTIKEQVMTPKDTLSDMIRRRTAASQIPSDYNLESKAYYDAQKYVSRVSQEGGRRKAALRQPSPVS